MQRETETKGLEAEAPSGDPTEWLTRIGRHSDRGAFKALFVAFAPRIKGFLLARGTDAATADELVQEVMLAVWRKASLFDPARGSAATWLFTMARNALVDRVRRHRREELDADDPAWVPDEADPAANAEHALVTAERCGELTRALADLPPEQVFVLQATYFKGRSMGELARDENLPLGTVKTRMRIALTRLRGVIGARKTS